MDKELKISTENALAAYNNTDANGRELLEHLFGKEIFAQDIKDKVKTFYDAVAILGNDNQAVIDYYAIADKTCTEDILAFAKLRVIAEALNEGWRPKFEEGEYRFYPWFYLYTKEEYYELNDEQKGHCVLRSGGSSDADRGVVFVYADYDYTFAYSFYGSRIAFRTRELADYAGRQFIDIWEKFLFA